MYEIVLGWYRGVLEETSGETEVQAAERLARTHRVELYMYRADNSEQCSIWFRSEDRAALAAVLRSDDGGGWTDADIDKHDVIEKIW